MYKLKINFLDFIPKTFFNLEKYEGEVKNKINTSFITTVHPLFYDKIRFLLIYKKLVQKQKIFIQQHGSGYQDGIKDFNLAIIIENRIGKSISWGKVDKKQICLAVPQIKKINVNYKSKKILFLSTVNSYFLHYCKFLSSYSNSMKRIELTLNLSNFLKNNIREKIFYKDHCRHFSEKELIRKNFKK
jgi:hypothetical protein